MHAKKEKIKKLKKVNRKNLFINFIYFCSENWVVRIGGKVSFLGKFLKENINNSC